jgi:hypothetical protein
MDLYLSCRRRPEKTSCIISYDKKASESELLQDALLQMSQPLQFSQETLQNGHLFEEGANTPFTPIMFFLTVH